jgi:hypothetical protein
MLNPTRNRGARGRHSIRLVRSFAGHNRALSGGDRDSLSRAKDIRIAQEWLSVGAPIADVITVLEVRHRFDFPPARCRAYAIEIVSIAQSLPRPKAGRNPHSKESTYAAA